MLHLARPAMGTMFECWLHGDDDEHLAAVAEATADEVVRVERLLSRFDPASEVSRINRDAYRQDVLIDREVLDVLLACQDAWRRTGGAFDIAAGSGLASPSQFVFIDPAARTVRFTKPEIRLDLGGYGKGYALDCAAALLRRHGVISALMHLGTSSVVALGRDLQGPWLVETPARPQYVELQDLALSCSATRAAGHDASDLIDPRTNQAVQEDRTCVVLAATASKAEALSTALVVLGQEYGVGALPAMGASEANVFWR